MVAMFLCLSLVGGSNAQLQMFINLFNMWTKNIRYRLLNWRPKYGMIGCIISSLECVRTSFFEMDITCGQGLQLKFTLNNVHLSLKTW